MTDEPSESGDDPLDALLARLADAPELDVETPPLRPIEPGARVGRFQIVREIGRGGFGVVYESRDVDLGRLVALKALRTDRLKRHGASDQKHKELRLSLLQQEAETVAKLQHPNIVTLFDLIVHDGLPFLVLELLSGETLQAALARGPLPLDEAIDACIQVARGLEHAHAAGVVHRDLKPSNVFRTRDGLVKLLDLGLARGLAGETLLPRAGTPGFMAPEQWRGAEDERSDVYGAGLLLHALLGGKVPQAFSGTGSTAAPKRARPPHPDWQLEVPTSAPPELAALIQKACAADPDQRIPSARALLESLESFRRSASTPLGAGASTPLLPAPPARAATPTQITGLIAIICAFIIIPWLVSRRIHQSEGTPPDPARPGPTAQVSHPTASSQLPETFEPTGALLAPRAGATALLLRSGLVLTAGGADDTGPSTMAELYDPQAQAGAGAFRATAPLGSARQGFSATLLPDGRALLVGGEGRQGSLGQSELFDPLAEHGRGAFTPGPPLQTPRSGHCAVALRDGRVLIAGGERNGAPLADAELFEIRPSASEAKSPSSPIPMRAARSHPACALLRDGRVLIAGGLGAEALASAELFEPLADAGRGAFAPAPPLLAARALAMAVALDDGRVLIAGGLGPEPGASRRGATAKALSSVELFDPTANGGRGAFQPRPPLLSPRYGGAALQTATGSVLLAGGTGENDTRLASAELLEPFQDGAPGRAAPNLSTPRGSPAAALLADGRVLIAGGDQQAGHSISSAELFLPRGLGHLGHARRTQDLSSGRVFAALAPLPDGSVLVAGGRDGDALDSIERYEPRTKKFLPAARLSSARVAATATSLADGSVLIAGGDDQSGAPLASAERVGLHGGELSFARSGPLGAARGFAGAMALPDGRALIVGGLGVDGALSSAELFEPRAANGGAFLPTGAMLWSRSEPMLAPLPDGRVLVAGGIAQSGAALASAEIFDPFADGGRGAFRNTGLMAQARSRGVLALLPSGKVLVAGGFGQAALASAELFDPLADNGRGAFQPTGGLSAARQRACASLLPSGLVLVAGGADAAGDALASTELFDARDDDGLGAFEPAAGLSVGRELPLCALLPRGELLVATGRNRGVLRSAELWSPE